MVGCFVACNQSIYLGLMDNVIMSERKSQSAERENEPLIVVSGEKRTFYD